MTTHLSERRIALQAFNGEEEGPVVVGLGMGEYSGNDRLISSEKTIVCSAKM